MNALLLVAAAGAFGGTALMPMKFAVGWRFENIWLLFSVCSYLISPWLVALVTVPQLTHVYADAGLQSCVLTALAGLGWGFAVVLNGIGVAKIGLSLASAILMGSSIALGSLFAILLKDPSQLTTRQGAQIVGLDVVMLVGVLLCAWAGRLRGSRASAQGQERSATAGGILICFAAGVLSTLFNVALANGGAISKSAILHGASSLSSANAIWSLAVSAGSLPSIVWCVICLNRERAWGEFGTSPHRNTALCVLMAVMWISSTVMYGAAAGELGKLGAAIGWPIYMSGIILVSNFWGWVTGEWRGVSGAPVQYMVIGIVVQITTIVVLGQVQ
jgi:L-rhamnose-H+ transport protein